MIRNKSTTLQISKWTPVYTNQIINILFRKFPHQTTINRPQPNDENTSSKQKRSVCIYVNLLNHHNQWRWRSTFFLFHNNARYKNIQFRRFSHNCWKEGKLIQLDKEWCSLEFKGLLPHAISKCNYYRVCHRFWLTKQEDYFCPL